MKQVLMIFAVICVTAQHKNNFVKMEMMEKQRHHDSMYIYGIPFGYMMVLFTLIIP